MLRVHVGEHQYSLIRIASQNLTGRVYAIQPWHSNIQNNQVRLQSPAFLRRISSVHGFSAYLPSYVRPE
jgi:hypothetical protein